MKIKQKIGLIVLATAVVITGLFVLRSYFGEKLGIFADVLSNEKIIMTKTVAAGDFTATTLSKLIRAGDTLQIQGQGSNQICGNYPGSVSLAGLPDSTNFNLSLSNVASSEYQVTNFVDNYHIGNEHKTQAGGGDFPLKPSGDNINTDNPGFSVDRGPGWIQIELDKPPTPGANVRNAVEGSIIFPAGVTLNANSIYYQTGGDGPVGANNGTHDLSSINDEVTLLVGERKVNFFLATAVNKDVFTINYCFTPESAFEGSVSGQVDLGALKPISSFRVITANFIAPRDEVMITTQISKDGISWLAGLETSGLRYNFQGETPRDSYCYRYIKYTIKLKTSATDPATAVALSGFNIYGGDICGAESGTSSGTQCSNGIDDDGDGKTDALVETGNNDRYTFPDFYQIRSFINSFSQYIDIPESSNAGALRADNTTALKICNLKGYATAESYTKRGFTSCGDNSIAYWDPAINNFKLINACQSNSFMMTLTCFNSLAACRDGVDNNGDGKIDYPNDPGCTSANDTSELQNDPSCSGPDDNTEAEQCANGIDDDNDGLTDRADPGCWTDQKNPESYNPVGDNEASATSECQDGVDNNNNELIDYPADLGCTSRLDYSEQPSTPEVVYLPGCANGIDDDSDGLIDYPSDRGCESQIDDSEKEPAKVCRAGDATNINFGLSDFVTKLGGASAGNTLIAGDGTTYKSGDKVNLVNGGEAVIDSTLSDKASPVYIKRGPGYVYLLFKNNSDSSALVASGKLVFSGAKITKAINGSTTLASSSPFFIGSPFEKQGDTVFDAVTNNDEFAINESGTEFTFGSMVGAGSDSVYIYYDYTYTLAGGCQCQDGIDNDNNGLIDYPADPSCSALHDNEEKTTLSKAIVDLVSSPAKALPALISSGPGFWVLIIIVLLISGTSSYLIIKKDLRKSKK